MVLNMPPPPSGLVPAGSCVGVDIGGSKLLAVRLGANGEIEAVSYTHLVRSRRCRVAAGPGLHSQVMGAVAGPRPGNRRLARRSE